MLDGCRCELVDTAGVAEVRGQTVLEAASAAAAHSHYRSADLLIECIDAASAVEAIPPAPSVLPDKKKTPAAWYTLTKADLVDPERLETLRRRVNAVAATSSLDARGLDDLVQRIAACARDNLGTTGTAVAATAARCRDSLLAAEKCLKAARQLATESAGEELVAVELREALHKIGLVVGAVYTDDILDRIFSRFCIGK
jgi:tRNA modification GTPase